MKNILACAKEITNIKDKTFLEETRLLK